MRTLVLVLAVVAVGCGPEVVGTEMPMPNPNAPLTITARVTNDYAESIISITVHVKSAETGRVVDTTLLADVRIGAGKTETRSFSAKSGDTVSFDFGAISLGDRHDVPTVTLAPVDPNKKTLRVVYDYDLALAQFGIKYRWDF